MYNYIYLSIYGLFNNSVSSSNYIYSIEQYTD
jgi:hypothetical protein